MASDVEGDGLVKSPARGGLARFYDGLGHLGGVILAIMTAAVFLQVIGRYMGWSLVDGLEEIPRYLFIWLVMIGSAAAMYRNEHTMLDYFVKQFGPRMQALIGIITTGACIAVFVYLIQLSVTLVPNAQMQTSAGLNLPLGYVFAAVPIGAVLIIVPMIRHLVGHVRALWPKHS